jgi:polar amino acid transport system permease protein
MLTTIAASIDTHLIVTRIFSPGGTFLRALGTTCYVAVIAMALGVLFGLLSALAHISRLRVLRLLSKAYVLIVRGTPLIVQIFFVYFGLQTLLGIDLFPREINLGVFEMPGAVVAGIFALAFNEGAYMSEIIRAGISSVDPGQMEAAQMVGMRRSMAMRRIVLPQAARIVVPPFGNEFNGMIKNTSLLAFIGVYEMFFDAQLHYSETFKPLEYFTAVAVWYLLLTTLWSIAQHAIERRLGVGDRDAPEGSRLRSWMTTRRSELGTIAR